MRVRWGCTGGTPSAGTRKRKDKFSPPGAVRICLTGFNELIKAGLDAKALFDYDDDADFPLCGLILLGIVLGGGLIGFHDTSNVSPAGRRFRAIT